MEIKVYSDIAAAVQTVCDARAELPVETELLIPDYLPQVFRIVKCLVDCVVLQKQVSSGRLTAEGYLRLSVYYQSDKDESLCRTEQKLPFSRAFELQPGEAADAQVYLTGETEYLNCRAVNQRRVDVRGAFALHAVMTAQLGTPILTAMEGAGVQQKLCALSGVRTVAVQEKLFTAAETVPFPETPEAVLDIGCAAAVRETRCAEGKTVVKGEIAASVLWRAAGESALRRTACSIPFNEVLETSGSDDGCSCMALCEPAGCTLSTDENGQNSLAVTASVSARVYRASEVLAVCDAFSTQCETQLTMGEAAAEQAPLALSQRVEAVAEGPLPDAAAQVVSVLAEALPPETVQEGDAAVLRGRVLVHVLCRSAIGEMDCYDKACEYTLPQTLPGAREDWTVNARAAVLDAVYEEKAVPPHASVQVQVEGFASQRKKQRVVQQIACGEPRAPKDDGVFLRICYAQAGEPLFDIARRYAAAPEAIAKANGLAQDVVEQPARLLIPSQEEV